MGLTFDPLTAILVVLVGAILGPFVTAGLKRLSWVDEQLGAAINALVNVAAFLGLWWLIDGAHRDKLVTYLLGALASSGLGGAMNNVWRKRWSPQARAARGADES